MLTLSRGGLVGTGTLVVGSALGGLTGIVKCLAVADLTRAVLPSVAKLTKSVLPSSWPISVPFHSACTSVLCCWRQYPASRVCLRKLSIAFALVFLSAKKSFL